MIILVLICQTPSGRLEIRIMIIQSQLPTILQTFHREILIIKGRRNEMMRKINHRKIIVFLSFISVTFFIMGFFFADPVNFNICIKNDVGCIDKFISIGDPLFFLSISLFIISIILFFLRREVFISWVKFAAPFLFIGIFIIAITSVDGSGGIGGVDFDRKETSWIISILFFFISLIIIIVKAIRLRKRDKRLENQNTN